MFVIVGVVVLLNFTIPLKLVVVDVTLNVGDEIFVVVTACKFSVPVFCAIANVPELPLNNTHPPFVDVLDAKIKVVPADALLVTALIVNVPAFCEIVDGHVFTKALILI